MNTGIHIHFQISVFIFLDKYLEVKSLDHMVASYSFRGQWSFHHLAYNQSCSRDSNMVKCIPVFKSFHP